MTKEEIVKYVTSSPENTNPNVLEGMLDELLNSKGGDSVFIVNLQDDTLDKRWAEIKAASESTIVVAKEDYQDGASFYYLVDIGTPGEISENYYAIFVLSQYYPDGWSTAGFKAVASSLEENLVAEYL